MFPAALAILAALSLAPAQEAAEARLQKGEQLAATLEYEAAYQTLERLVADLPASHPRMVQARLSAGCVAVVLGHDEEARTHFSWVLEKNPDETLVGPDSDSPKIRMFYEKIRTDVLHGNGNAASGGWQASGAQTGRDPRNPLWILGVTSTSIGAISAIVGTSLAFWQDALAGDQSRSNWERRRAQQTGRLWLGLGLSGALLSAASLTGTLWLVPEVE